VEECDCSVLSVRSCVAMLLSESAHPLGVTALMHSFLNFGEKVVVGVAWFFKNIS
jgi:hypothetical protein